MHQLNQRRGTNLTKGEDHDANGKNALISLYPTQIYVKMVILKFTSTL